MKTITLVEVMKHEVCHSHKTNCDICPILSYCKNGVVDDLIKETQFRAKYTINVEE